MKKNWIKTLIVAGLVVGTGTVFAISAVHAAPAAEMIATNGSVAALADEEYTIEEMLVYALQDEYNARAEYEAILAEFGEIRIFSNIIIAEELHIELLLPLFETYGIAVPADESAASVVVPDSLESAFATAVEAEKNNIAMYDAFLATEDLPEDLATVFTQLRNASIRHQNAFARNQVACGVGGAGMYQWRNRWNQFAGQGTQNGSGTGTRSQNGSCGKR